MASKAVVTLGAVAGLEATQDVLSGSTYTVGCKWLGVAEHAVRAFCTGRKLHCGLVATWDSDSLLSLEFAGVEIPADVKPAAVTATANGTATQPAWLPAQTPAATPAPVDPRLARIAAIEAELAALKAGTAPAPAPVVTGKAMLDAIAAKGRADLPGQRLSHHQNVNYSVSQDAQGRTYVSLHFALGVSFGSKPKAAGGRTSPCVVKAGRAVLDIPGGYQIQIMGLYVGHQGIEQGWVRNNADTAFNMAPGESTVAEGESINDRNGAVGG